MTVVVPPPVAAETSGPSDGPVVLLTHGFGGTLRMWDPTVGALAAAGYRTIAWDLPGHGWSDWGDDPASYTLDNVLAAMARLLDEAGAERAVVGGLSLGGQLSLAFHLRHRERVAALLLADTGPGFRDEVARAKWNRGVEGRARYLERLGLDGLGDEAGVGLDRHRSATGLIRSARGYLVQDDASIIDSLPTVAVPTWVAVGSEDRHFLAATDYLAAKIPGAHKDVIAEAGHVANVHQPERFNAALLGFLAEAGVQRG